MRQPGLEFYLEARELYANDAYDPYKELSFKIIENALDDIKKYRYSKTATGRRLYSAAMEFLCGGPMLTFWCSVMTFDPTVVAKGVRDGNVHSQL